MSLSKGLGTHWGNYLIADPFQLSFLKRLIKKVVERISRLIPKKRKRVLYKIPVTGDLVIPEHEIATIQVSGQKDFFGILWTILDEED